MRRTAKRSAGCTVLVALCATLLFSASALAVPHEIGSFGCGDGLSGNPAPCVGKEKADGTPDEESLAPDALAVNEATGDVYIVDKADDAVDVFSSTGSFESQIFVPAGSFEFASEPDIAVDNSSNPATEGNVYVAPGWVGSKAFAFDSTGSLLWQVEGFVEPCGVAVDPSGNPWVMDYQEGLRRYNASTGAVENGGKAISGISNRCRIAFDSTGDILAVYSGAPQKYHINGESAEPLVEYPGETIMDVAVDLSNDNVFGMRTVSGSFGAVAWESDGTPLDYNAFNGAHEGFGPGGPGITADGNSHRFYMSAESGKVVIFNIARPSLTVGESGEGEGSVACDGGTCDPQYWGETEVTLAAKPEAGSVLTGWKVNGSAATCPGTGACKVKLTADTTVEAEFAFVKHTLKVKKAGAGEGTITSEPAGISCAAACSSESAEFKAEELIVLKAAGVHGKFTGWSGGGCAGVGNCVIELEADTEVTASFAPIERKLTIAKTGTGEGSISCDTGSGAGPCLSEYLDGTKVTLAASPASGSTFVGWGGACAGTAGCTIELNADSAVSASFDAKPSEGGGGGASTPPATTPPAPPVSTPPAPAPLHCKKGFKRKTVKGKARCVKVHKHRHKRKRH